MRRIRSLILALAFILNACSSPPSNALPISQSTRAPIPSPAPSQTAPPAVLPNTGESTGTQSLTQAPTLPSMTTSTSAPIAKEAPAFDLTQRLGHPPTDTKADFLQWMQANTPEESKYLLTKWARMGAILQYKDATDPRVIEAFLRAPREYFFNAYGPDQAYASAAIPIGYGQTISGPHLVAHMTQAIDPQPNQKVLEIGTGSGYQSAVLAELTNFVYTIEIVPQLAQQADEKYTKLSKSYPEYANIKRKNADGYYGWPEYAPFDRIIVTAGIDHVPPALLNQLAPNGIMVIPVGPPSGQTVLKITKQVQPDGSISFIREDIYHGRKILFVPFTGVPNGQ